MLSAIAVKMSKGETEENRELSYGDLQQSLINTYRDGHLKTIEYAENLLGQYKRQLKRAENIKDKKKYQRMIVGVEEELQNLRNKTKKY
jgi:hypothetical protein